MAIILRFLSYFVLSSWLECAHILESSSKQNASKWLYIYYLSIFFYKATYKHLYIHTCKHLFFHLLKINVLNTSSNLEHQVLIIDLPYKYKLYAENHLANRFYAKSISLWGSKIDFCKQIYSRFNTSIREL